ncbi:hypothetical protein E3J62_12305 [candidate division TA06 bacterium]|uniref:Uncharacterized protein n=1 Tax=candidate division TA06 bacterium TaxID=2250710 RepID=A0A523UMR1_UNCT6|nr:MAG: hypothetical protein E3J62_12305 [candidate division TA06 bacterium]
MPSRSRVDQYPVEVDSPESVSDSIQILQPLSLKVIRGVSKGQMDSVLISRRRFENLRGLSPLESGKQISEIPSGTFFFASTYYFDTRGDNITDVLKRCVARRIRSLPDYMFEIHYLSEREILIMAFVSDETASRICRLDGSSERKVTLSPRPWNHVDALVLLPIDRFLRAKERVIEIAERDRISVLDVTLQ